MNFVPAEKSQTIRQPSTANLMVDSLDRFQGNGQTQPVENFQISKPNAILNGFFTRIGLTELVLDWNQANIGNTETFEIEVGATPFSVTVPTDFYTVAQLLDELVLALNAAGTGLTFSINSTSRPISLDATGAFTITGGLLAQSLGFELGVAGTQFPVGSVDLKKYRYLDFISAQLTYNQELKDSSTAPTVRDVLARWYFAWDSPPLLDTYGFPIEQGYTPFTQRRIFNPPKQIKWDPSQPIGNISFQVFDDTGSLIVGKTQMEYMMTLQVSEV